MLRAIAVRQIKPLGSDRELPVDVRLIVATNVDLRGLIQTGSLPGGPLFPAEGDHAAHHPAAGTEGEHRRARAALPEGAGDAHGPGRHGLEQGRPVQAERYDWAGNVRELQNCLTRAAVMAERPVIQADDIPIDVDGWEPECPPPPAGLPRRPRRPSSIAGSRRPYRCILARGRITRSDYQAHRRRRPPRPHGHLRPAGPGAQGCPEEDRQRPGNLLRVDPRFSALTRVSTGTEVSQSARFGCATAQLCGFSAGAAYG